MTLFLRQVLPLMLVIVSPIMFGQNSSAPDTIIRFKQNQLEYDFVLEGRNQTFDYDTVLYNVFDVRCRFNILNNTGQTIAIEDIYHGNGSMLFESGGKIGSEVAAGESFQVRLRMVDRPGQQHKSLQVKYRIGDVRKSMGIDIRWYNLNLKALNRQFQDTLLQPGKARIENMKGDCLYDPEFHTYGYAPNRDERPFYLSVPNERFCLRKVYNFPTHFRFRIINDTRKTVNIESVTGSTKQILFFVKTRDGWSYLKPLNSELPPDSSILVKGVNYNFMPCVVDIDLNITYNIRKKTLTKSIPIWGIIDLEERPPVAAKTQTKSLPPGPVNPPGSAKTGAKAEEPIPIKQTQDKTDYDISLEHSKYRFDMDTLRFLAGKPLVFNFFNPSNDTIELLYIDYYAETVFPEPIRTAGNLAPGENYPVKIFVNPLKTGKIGASITAVFGDGKTIHRTSVWCNGYVQARQELTPSDSLFYVFKVHQFKYDLKQRYVKQTRAGELYRYPQRSDGLAHFNNYELTERIAGKTSYGLILQDEIVKQPYGIPKKKEPETVFSWDTIAGLGEPLTLKLENLSDNLLTITEISWNNDAVLYEGLKSKLLVKPGDHLPIQAFVSPVCRGHFYHRLTIKYSDVRGVHTKEIQQWGFVPMDVVSEMDLSDSLTFANRLEMGTKSGSVSWDILRLYAQNQTENVSADYTIKLVSGKSGVLKPIGSGGEAYFQLNVSDTDSVLVQLIHPEYGVVSKGVVPPGYRSSSLKLYPHIKGRDGDYEYTLYGGTRPYKAIDNLYYVAWTSSKEEQEAVQKYLLNYGIDVSKGNQFHKIVDLSRAMYLQNLFVKSGYDIHLCPVIHYSTVNEFGWGGDCEWYAHQFDIIFYPHVTESRIAEIFKEFGLSGYKKQSYGNTETNRYGFELPDIVSPKYIKLLDKLWSLPEVSGVGQQHGRIEGLD